MKKYIVVTKFHVSYDGLGMLAPGTIISRGDDGATKVGDKVVTDLSWIDRLIAGYESTGSSPFIVAYSDEMLQQIMMGVKPATLPEKNQKNQEHMKVVKSDADLVESVDIKDTQIGKNKMNALAAERAAETKDKSGKMPIIRGDETPGERVERIAGRSEIPIVEADSSYDAENLGGTSLNAGQVKSPKEDPKTDEAPKVAAKTAAKPKTKAKAASGGRRKPGPKPGSKRRSLDDQIAEAEKKLARLKAKKAKEEHGK